MRELADARNQGETLVYTTEKTLKEHRESLDEDTVSTIESRIADLRSALESDDPADIRSKSESLTEAAHTLAQAVYERAQSQQAAGGSENGGASEPEDEVVEDAEYEVVDEEARKE